jgi:hypothetical protein
MIEIKPTECTVCEPWGFSAESDKARKNYCPACAGTGLVYALPDTHRIVPVEPTDAMIDALFPGSGEHTCRELYKAMLAASQEWKDEH